MRPGGMPKATIGVGSKWTKEKRPFGRFPGYSFFTSILPYGLIHFSIIGYDVLPFVQVYF